MTAGDAVSAVLATFVVLAILPVLTGLFQYLVAIVSVFATHLDGVKPFSPRISILIPAWNEDAVIEVTIDRLMALDYPTDRLRVYVVDDASTDQTPFMVMNKSKQYPGRVFHVRRVAGGEGKAHTLNYGLDELWRSEWTEAVLIMDADVIY
ncbi:MAG: glycosyltransferase family 2 protein, partial [Myxococcota bacterium]